MSCNASQLNPVLPVNYSFTTRCSAVKHHLGARGARGGRWPARTRRAAWGAPRESTTAWPRTAALCATNARATARRSTRRQPDACASKPRITRRPAFAYYYYKVLNTKEWHLNKARKIRNTMSCRVSILILFTAL